MMDDVIETKETKETTDDVIETKETKETTADVIETKGTTDDVIETKGMTGEVIETKGMMDDVIKNGTTRLLNRHPLLNPRLNHLHPLNHPHLLNHPPHPHPLKRVRLLQKMTTTTYRLV
jgi:hypothetical protein